MEWFLRAPDNGASSLTKIYYDCLGWKGVISSFKLTEYFYRVQESLTLVDNRVDPGNRWRGAEYYRSAFDLLKSAKTTEETPGRSFQSRVHLIYCSWRQYRRYFRSSVLHSTRMKIITLVLYPQKGVLVGPGIQRYICMIAIQTWDCSGAQDGMIPPQLMGPGSAWKSLSMAGKYQDKTVLPLYSPEMRRVLPPSSIRGRRKHSWKMANFSFNEYKIIFIIEEADATGEILISLEHKESALFFCNTGDF